MPRMAREGAEVYLYSFFNLNATWEWVINATPRSVYLPGKGIGSRRIGPWMGPRADVDGCGEPRQHRDSIRGPSNP